MFSPIDRDGGIDQTNLDSVRPARVVYSQTVEVVAKEDGLHHVVPITDASKPAIPETLRASWRSLLDSLADELGVAAAVITVITREGLRVFASSAHSQGLYAEEVLSPFGEGSYAETVIATDSALSVEDASSSPLWRNGPDAAFGMMSCYGIPLHWNDGSFFGCLCILDGEARRPGSVRKTRASNLLSTIEHDLDELQTSNLADTDPSVNAMDEMFRYVPGGIFSYSAEEDESFSLISVNMLTFLGYAEDEFRRKFENRFSLMVWHEDRARVLAEIDEQIRHGSFDTCEYRIQKKDGQLVWVHDEGHIVTDENGKRWFFVVIVDITDAMDERQQLDARNRRLEELISVRQSLLDDIPGGVRVFLKRGDDIVCVNANSYYADMIGIDKETLIGESFKANAERIHPDDRERHKIDTTDILNRDRASEGTYRFLNARTGKYHWYHVEAALQPQSDGSELAYFHYTDVDDLKHAEDEAQTDQNRFKLAVRGAHLAVWEYDIASKRMIVPDSESGSFTRAHYGIKTGIVENVPESMLDMGWTDKDRARFLALYDEIRSGSEYATADVWFKLPDDANPRCDRITYYVEKDAAGIPVRAYGVGTDITAQKQDQERFHQSIQSILSANPAALCTFQINLTQDVCFEGHGISPYILKTLRSDTASGLFRRCLDIIPYKKDRQLFSSVFDRNLLLAGFTEGKSNQHIDYRRTDNHGVILWVRTFVSMLKNPETGDIEGAIYSIDISHEKRRDDVFEMLTGEEYELIALLDLDTNSVEAFHIGDSLPTSYEATFHEVGDVCDFDHMRENGARTWVAADERKKYLDGTKPEYLKKMLDKGGHYELTVKGEIPERGTVYRKLQHYYLDDERREVLIADSDVTESYLQQQREMEEKRRAQLERTLIDTVNSLPASSALFRILDNRTITPDRYSDEFCRMGGYTQEDDLYRDNAYGGVHPDDVETVMQLIHDHLDDDVPFSSVYRIAKKNGDYMWVSVKFVHFNFGDAEYLYAVYTDIDDVKRQERQLAEQYEAAQKYLDSVSSAYLSTGRANLTRNIVEEFSDDMLKLPADEPLTYDAIIEHFLSRITNETDRTECARLLDRADLIDAYQRGERTRSAVFRMRSETGEMRWVKTSLSLTKHPGTGDIVAFNAVSDVTREELTRAIMDEVLPRQYDFISCIDAKRDEIVLFVSGGDVFNGLSIASGTSFQQSEHDYCEAYVVSSDCDRYRQFMDLTAIVSALDKGKRYLDSFSIDEGAGPRIVQIEFFYIDRESGLVASSRSDITDAQRRQIEQEETLRVALDAAESANAAKSEFLSRMSHDMRTPLNGIIGMTYLTEGMEMSDEVRQNLSKIDTSSKFLLGLINDILDMTKAESSQIELHPEPYSPFEFYEYLNAVIRPLCEDKHQTLVMNTNPPEDVVPIFDKLRINQVLFNLLSNAIKFTPEGGTITYGAQFGALDAQKRIPLHITVSDTGIGITEDFQKVLFDPFTQEEREDASATRGTGLGLSIAKKLVELMGGTISVKSEVGSGTTFAIDLLADSAPASETASASHARDLESPITSLEGKRILLCEDNPLNQEIAVSLLERQGAIVDVAENGRRGVERFEQSTIGFYGAVLMDIRMPMMDGYEAARCIRALDRDDAHTVPIIAMTADAFADDVQRCLEAGMNAHLAKPIDPEKLIEVLGSNLASTDEGK